MKRITLLTLFVALMSLATQAQENTYNMVIEMTNGTKITVGPDDIRSLTFNNGELTVTGLNLGELIETLATKQTLEQIRQEMYVLIEDCRYQDNQFFAPLAEFFDKSYWDREDIGEALVQFLSGVIELAKTNQDNISMLEERHQADIAELKAALMSLIQRIEALEGGLRIAMKPLTSVCLLARCGRHAMWGPVVLRNTAITSHGVRPLRKTTIV